MRTPAHAIRMRTYACAPYRECAPAHGLYAAMRTLCAGFQLLRSTPSGNAPRLLGRGCVPLVQGAAGSRCSPLLKLLDVHHSETT